MKYLAEMQGVAQYKHGSDTLRDEEKQGRTYFEVQCSAMKFRIFGVFLTILLADMVFLVANFHELWLIVKVFHELSAYESIESVKEVRLNDFQDRMCM